MHIEKILKYFLISAFFLILILLEGRYTLSQDYGNIALANSQKGQYKTAFESAKHALIFNIHNEKAYVVIAKLNLLFFEQTHEQEAFHTAFVAIRNAIDNDPYESFYYDIAGQLYMADNDFANAIRMYQIAATIYPHYLYFQNQLALLYHLTDRNNEALAILDSQSQLYKDYLYAFHPDSLDIVNAYFLKACILYKTGRYVDVLKPLDQIVALAHSGFSLNNPARRDRRMITLQQITAFANFDKGLIYKRLGDYKKAQIFFAESYQDIPALKSNNSFLMVFNLCE
ncbi:MAG: tetratricopeptide repeat protein [bacterium]